LPLGARFGEGTRGLKKPGAPYISVAVERHWLTRRCWASLTKRTGMSGTLSGGSVTVSQNSRKRCTREAGGLPTISAALMAPIEMPATQSG
jgi:hypothetical protein